MYAIAMLKIMKKSSHRLQDFTTNFLLIQGILGHPLFCVHIDDKTKNVRYGLLGISFDSKKAEIGSIIDNLPDTSYLYNIPKSAWTKKVSVTSVVYRELIYFLNLYLCIFLIFGKSTSTYIDRFKAEG